MMPFANLILGSGVTAGLTLLISLVGYAFVARVSGPSRLVRLALASQVGLAWVVFGAALLGAWFPLRGWPSWLIWSPGFIVWLLPTARRVIIEDTKHIVRHRCFAAGLIGLGVVWLALTLPFAIQPDLAFFEGASNHDNFFWIMGAEHLQRNPYLAWFEASAAFPVFNSAQAIIGLSPAWGRMGAEGLLAVVGGALGLSTIRIFNFAVVALSVPWLLTVFATGRILCQRCLSPRLTVLAAICQPVFIFFIANGNLPNLVGALFGGGLWLATILVLESETKLNWGLGIGIVLLVHGLLATYPEVVPFALLPAACLCLWRLIAGTTLTRRNTLLIGLAVAIAAVINPYTAQRAWYGFWISFSTARDDVAWANLMNPLIYTEYIPGLITLSIPAVERYGTIFGALTSLAIITTVVQSLRQRSGSVALPFSIVSFVLLLAYTIVTSFSYGWQKSVQFSGIQIAALTSVIAADRFSTFRQKRSRGWWWNSACFALTAAVLLHGVVASAWDSLDWSFRKGLTEKQLAVRDKLAAQWPGQEIFVDGATFSAPFFQSMWSSRVLQKNPIVFSSRDTAPGGYLRDTVNQVDPATTAYPPLLYAATPWLEAFDPSAKVELGDRMARIVRPQTLVSAFTGVYPDYGIPQFTEDSFAFNVRPRRDGWFEFSLKPTKQVSEATRLVAITSAGGKESKTIVRPSSSGDFAARLPLRGGQLNTIHVTATDPPVGPDDGEVFFPFFVSQMRIRLSTGVLSPQDGLITFGQSGNYTRYETSGLSLTDADHTWTEADRVLIRFSTLPTENAVDLRMVAFPFLPPSGPEQQRCDLFFNGNLVFTAPFTEPGVLRASIPKDVWNESQIAELELRLPDAVLQANGQRGSRALALVKLETSSSP